MPDPMHPGPTGLDDPGDPRDLAPLYALDAVSDSERADIEQRLRTADPETVRDFWVFTWEVREAMGALSVLDARPAPPELEGRIHTAIDALDAGSARTAHTEQDPTATGPEVDEVTLARRRKSRRLRWSAAAAAVAVAIGVGAGVLGQQAADEPASTVTAAQVLQHRDARAETTDMGGGGTLTVHVSAELNAAAVAFDSVPAAQEGQVYQLWLLGADATARSAGVLNQLPAPNAPYVTEFAGSNGLAVTVEPDGGSPAPTSEPLAAVEFG